MKPMLAHIFEPKRWPENTICHVQPKLNGVRALYQNGVFQSRDELPWNPGVLDHLIAPLKGMFPDPKVILDGELYVHGWSLQRINGAVQIARREPREDTHLVEYWVFDVVNYQSPFIERVAPIFNTIKMMGQKSSIKIVPTYRAILFRHADAYYDEFVFNGFEGIMYRIGHCPYTWPSMGRKISDKNNRTWHLLKRKNWLDAEFECIGVEEGEGKRQGMVGYFVCKIEKNQASNRNIFHVGPGVLTEQELTHFFNEPPIGRMIKTKYLTLSDEGIPQNPGVIAVL